MYVQVRPVDEQAVLRFLGRYAPHWRSPEVWGTEDAEECLTRALGGSPPSDGSAFYFHSRSAHPLYPGLECVIVSFDDVESVTLGISVPEYESPALHLEALKAFTGSEVGFWAWEWPPPRSEADWQEALDHNPPGRE
jgi:hypothetical protein